MVFSNDSVFFDCSGKPPVEIAAAIAKCLHVP